VAYVQQESVICIVHQMTSKKQLFCKIALTT
jgi:hypothetical protein